MNATESILVDLFATYFKIPFKDSRLMVDLLPEKELKLALWLYESGVEDGRESEQQDPTPPEMNR